MAEPQPAYTPTSHVLVQTDADRAATPPQQLTCVISADLRPGDRQALLELFDRSSPDTRRERFHGSLSVFPQRYLDDILTGAHGQLALVARDTCHRQNYGKVFGLASAAPVGPGTAEFAVWVDDAWQGHGVGTLLVRAILNLLAQQGMSTAVGIMESGRRQPLGLRTAWSWSACRWPSGPPPPALRPDRCRHAGGAGTAAGAVADRAVRSLVALPDQRDNSTQGNSSPQVGRPISVAATAWARTRRRHPAPGAMAGRS